MRNSLGWIFHMLKKGRKGRPITTKPESGAFQQKGKLIKQQLRLQVRNLRWRSRFPLLPAGRETPMSDGSTLTLMQKPLKYPKHIRSLFRRPAYRRGDILEVSKRDLKKARRQRKRAERVTVRISARQARNAKKIARRKSKGAIMKR